MIVISQDFRRLTTAPKLSTGFPDLSKMIQLFRNYFGTGLTIEKPGEIYCSKRGWNRNSAFIMAQYEMAQSKQSAGELND